VLIEAAHGKASFLHQVRDSDPGEPLFAEILVGDTLYVSGEIGFDLHTGQIPKDFDAEVKACLDKLLLM
jgi:enamine deaminase RidA (YjgF/YER057c/UK114 family)